MTPGVYRGKIDRHNWTQSQQNPDNLGLMIWVSMVDTLSGQEETIPGVIWFTEKSINFARMQLREVGFDPDATHIREIGETVSLVGREVDCVVEDNRGKSRIAKFGKGGGMKPTPDALDRIQSGLKGAKKAKAEKFDDLPEDFFNAEGKGKF